MCGGAHRSRAGAMNDLTAEAGANGAAIDQLWVDIGHRFNDHAILLRSLAHRSWCAENGDPDSNERLEFLGDSVLGLVVSHYVFEHFPHLPEGQLSEVRAGVVNARVLAEIAAELSLGGCLLLGKGED